MRKEAIFWSWIGTGMMIVAGCGEPREASRHEIPVVADGTAFEDVETDEGYRVELESATMRFQTVEFTVGGREHGEEARSLADRVASVFVGEATAHPNHAAGGEVAGRLEGPVVARWQRDEIEPVDDGEFLEDRYAGYNLEFGTDSGMGDDGDPGPEQMARLEGRAVDDEGDAIEFFVEFAHFDAAEVIGGALSLEVGGEAFDAVALQFLPYDEWSEQSVFDGVEFSRFAGRDERVEIPEETSAHTLMRLALTSHEFYGGRTISDREGAGE